MRWISISLVLTSIALALFNGVAAQIAQNSASKNGTLVIAGSGIASIKHITLETLSHIKEADKIYYAVSDPATKAFIQTNSRGNCSDLAHFYDKNKSRYETYVQMSEVILNDVREGLDVLGIFYGHPGIFVLPSHRAIAIARDEGYTATMLPGVSSQDYLFADLGIDPALPNGWMTQDATEVVLRGKRLLPDVHNVILQVGAIALDTADYEKSQFQRLVDVLDNTFNPNHIIVHYIGAILPQSKTVMDRFALSELRNPAVYTQFTSTSTFYIPPHKADPIDSGIAFRLGLSDVIHTSDLYPYSTWSGSIEPSSNAYGPFERQAVAKLSLYEEQLREEKQHFSPSMQAFMADLALQPKLATKYAANPSTCVAQRGALTDVEKYALGFNHPAPLYALATLNVDTSSGMVKREIMDTIARSVNNAPSDRGSSASTVRRESLGAPDSQMPTINNL